MCYTQFITDYCNNRYGCMCLAVLTCTCVDTVDILIKEGGPLLFDLNSDLIMALNEKSKDQHSYYISS